MSDTKIPIPPIPPSKKLHKDADFWSQILISLDAQFQYMEENRCYGKIFVEFKFWDGKMTDKTTAVTVNDKIISTDKKPII